jgi:hypothetical protein
MPILSGGPLYKDRTKPIEDYTSSFGERADAILEGGRDNSFLRALGSAASVVVGGNPLAAAQDAGRMVGLDVMAELDPASRVNAAEARKAAEQRGVKLDISDDAYFSPGELNTVLYFKERERKQQAIRSRRPKTWGGFATEIGVGLAATLQDPVQIAANFIPVVSQARYAMWLERAGSAGGRAAVRAGVGAAEGLAGAAVLEPFFYGQASALDLDYGAEDSFLNLAFGTVLGGGLHVAGGAVADGVTGRYRQIPDVKGREALTDAVTSLDEGRGLDVGPILSDPRMNPANDTGFMARELNRAPDIPEADIARALDDIKAVRSGATEKPADLVAAIKGMGGIKIVDNEGRITSEGGDVREIFNRRYPPGLVNNKDGIPLDYVREALQEQGWLPRTGDGELNETTTADVLDMLARWNGGDKPRPIGDVKGEDIEPTRAEVAAAGITKADSEDIASFKLAKYRTEQAMKDAPELVRDPSIMPDTYDPATGYEPPEYEATRLEADRAEASSADYDLDGELEALNEMLDAGRARGTLDAADEAALELAAEFDQIATRGVRATRAAASCILGVA